MTTGSITSLVEAAEAVPAWTEDAVRERDTRIRRLITGCSSWDEYLRVSGEVRGLEVVIGLDHAFPLRRGANSPRRPDRGS